MCGGRCRFSERLWRFMRGFEIHSVTGAALQRLHREHMCRDFPRNELKPLEMLESLTAQGINSVWAVERAGELVAYYVLARLPGCSAVLLDYFAVEPRLRSRGVGAAVLRNLAARLGPEECLLIESELPAAGTTEEERHTRERRLDFYRRCGAVDTGVRTRLFGVDYVLLCLGAPPEAPEEAYCALYRSMVPEHRLRGNLALLPNE